MNDATIADSTQRYLDAFRQLEARLPDNKLSALRRVALERFADAGFPGTRVEEWKYTNLRRLERRNFALSPATPADLPDPATLPLADANLPTFAFVNGRFAPALSRLDALPDGVHFHSLATLLREQPDTIAPRLEASLAAASEHRADSLAALNGAFFMDGAAIDIDSDARLAQPLHLMFISRRADESVVSHPRVFIRAGRDSDAAIIEHHIAIDEAANFANSVGQIDLDENATLRHYRVQEESRKSFHISNTHIHQARGSRYQSLNIDFGGALVRHDLHVHLEAEEAEAILDGLFILSGRQHCDNHTWAHHLSPNTYSRERYKGILDNRSRGVFNGKVHVAPHAQKVDSSQASHNLLLSDKAEIDTKPELEIYADDVQCNHGATVGQIDETALFYLRSRGLDVDQARRLLTTAFAREILDTVDHAPLKTYLEQALQGVM